MEKKKPGGKRILVFVGVLAVLFTVMQIAGWQISMKYGTSVHMSEFFQQIGMLESWQCAVCGIVEFGVWFALLYRLFVYGETRSFAEPGENAAERSNRRVWIGIGLGLYAIYMVWLVALYPGFYNYDMGNQLPQIMYPEVSFSAFHPLLHTIIGGGIITMGYHLYSADLTFGVFLYNVVQMGLCTFAFTCALRFLYRRTGRKLLTVLAFAFYAFCPSVVLYAMSTTKDVSCFAFLLLALLKGYTIMEKRERGEQIRLQDKVSLCLLLIIACLLRNNIIYAVIAFAVIALAVNRDHRRQRLVGYACVIAGYFLANNALIAVCHAERTDIEEALSVPIQQISRVYQNYGESAFTDEELELLYAVIEPGEFNMYDPMISDSMKWVVGLHIDVFKGKVWEYAKLWLKKGLEYPGTYIAATLDNTYQAWYPGTVLRESDGYHRYFWVTDNSNPKWQALYEWVKGLNDEDSYTQIPVLRLFFVTGTMLWITLAAWFYGWYRRDRKIIAVLGLSLLVAGTALCGPVSDIRYYLNLFYLAPVCVGAFMGHREATP